MRVSTERITRTVIHAALGSRTCPVEATWFKHCKFIPCLHFMAKYDKANFMNFLIKDIFVTKFIAFYERLLKTKPV